MSIGTHVTHCCVRHGCKYGDDREGGFGCPVVDRTHKQEYPCEECYNDAHYFSAAGIVTDYRTLLGRLKSYAMCANHLIPTDEISSVKIEGDKLLVNAYAWDSHQNLGGFYIDLEKFNRFVREDVGIPE